MKNIFLVVANILIVIFSHAQNGLEDIIVEKYYISNASDSIGSIGKLPEGSVTYRIFVDMIPGYKFQAAYGVAGHELRLSTTTSFFNNEDRGGTTATYSKLNARNNTVMLDSWFSVGGACTGNFGILKSEDDVATGGATVINNTVPPILQNADPSAGIPLTVHDGLFAGSPASVTFVGISSAFLAPFNATSQSGNLLSTFDGSWASLNGSTGPILSTNRVLIAQMTTDGAFYYELNIQIGTPSGGTENYVASNPAGNEILFPQLKGTLGGSNVSPEVNITAPSNGASFITGAIVGISANATDVDGTIASVEFFVDGISVGIDNSIPFNGNYTSATGSHTLTAVATDNNGAQTTSSTITINVSNNPPPSVNITSPGNGAAFITGSIIPITANATDNGSIASVEFFVDGISIGIDNSSPYSVNYTGVLGSHSLTAIATDNLGAQSTSLIITIIVGNNPPPTINIASPSAGSLFIAPAIVTITANASDPNGTVSLVQFYVNGNLVGSDVSSPYSFNWTSVIGQAVLTAKATDNLGAQTTSASVTISIADPNIPYKILTLTNSCKINSFCLPIVAIDSVDNVIGYDLVLNYNKTKMRPTGVITVDNDLINPAYVDIASSIDSIAGLINISLYFNTSAPANTEFHGIGNLFCTEFTRTVNFNPIDTALFSVPSINESYIVDVSTRLVDAGKIISFKDSTFNGSLRFWLNNNPIKYKAAVPNAYLITNIYGNNNLCNSKSVASVQPDTLGNFRYSIWNGQNINIEKDILGTTSVQPVVNGFDALLTRKILVNDPSFTPNVYQAIAMDINMDGKISAGDVSQINQRAVLMIPEFKQSWNYDSAGVSNGQLSKDWLFIDSVRIATNLAYKISTTFPANDGIGFSKARVPIVPFCLPIPVSNIASCPQIISETYKGVLLGDVDGNYSTVVPNNLFKQSGNEKIVINLSQARISESYIEIPVSVFSGQDINALDFSMQFNHRNLNFNSIINQATYLQSTSNYNFKDKTIRFTSNSFSNYDLNEPVVYIRFSIYSRQIMESDLISVVGYLNGNEVNVEIINSDLNMITEKNNIKVNVYPNPSIGTLNVIISEIADIQLLDINDRQVYFRPDIFPNQMLEINTGNLANGIYLMKVYSKDYIAMKKIIIQN